MEKVFNDLLARFDENTFEKDGKLFLKKDFEIECFKAFTNYGFVHNPANFDIVSPLNDRLLAIELNVIAGGQSGIDVAQMTANASTDECNIHRTYPAFDYGGAGELDHEYHHTGEGYPGADFKMKDDFRFFFEDPITKEVKEGILKKGKKIDAKAYWSMEATIENDKTKKGAKDYLADNHDGSLGHFGDGLIIRIINENNTWYYCGNRAGFLPVRLVNFKPELYYHHVSLRIAQDGLLVVNFKD